ncbi:MAG: hypothetical protein WAR57_03490 [Candidatus Phosphoribacter sp.]|nr:hypothetical protein [Actinomycetales bacterium]
MTPPRRSATLATLGLSAVAVVLAVGGCTAGGSVTNATAPETMMSSALRSAPAGQTAPTTLPTTSPPRTPATPATNAPTTGKPTFPLGAGTFGAVKLPALADQVLAAAAPTLGPPTRNELGSGCELAGPDQKSIFLRWGDDLTAYGEAGPGATLMIDSWTVSGTGTKVPLTLPHGTSIGMKRANLLAALSGEKIDDSQMFAEGDIVIKDDLWWSLDASNTKVVSVTYNPHLCE